MIKPKFKIGDVVVVQDTDGDRWAQGTILGAEYKNGGGTWRYHTSLNSDWLVDEVYLSYPS